MKRLPFLDAPEPRWSFGELLVMLVVLCLLLGFVFGLFVAAVLIGGL